MGRADKTLKYFLLIHPSPPRRPRGVPGKFDEREAFSYSLLSPKVLFCPLLEMVPYSIVALDRSRYPRDPVIISRASSSSSPCY